MNFAPLLRGNVSISFVFNFLCTIYIFYIIFFEYIFSECVRFVSAYSLTVCYYYYYYCIDKSTEWFTIPACPSLMCFFFFLNRGNTKGTNSSKLLCLMFVSVLLKFVSGLIFWFLENLWFDNLCAE